MIKKVNCLKAGFAILMAVYGAICVKDLPDAGMLDRVNLVAHEAGHLLLSWFGEFMQITGGTLGQLAVPAAFTVYFFFRREFYSSSVALFWTGQNFLGISVYIRDAQAMALPLVTVGSGEDTIHDWNYILAKFGLLRWDQALGNIAVGTGAVIMALSVVWAFSDSLNFREKDQE